MVLTAKETTEHILSSDSNHENSDPSQHPPFLKELSEQNIEPDNNLKSENLPTDHADSSDNTFIENLSPLIQSQINRVAQRLLAQHASAKLLSEENTHLQNNGVEHKSFPILSSAIGHVQDNPSLLQNTEAENQPLQTSTSIIAHAQNTSPYQSVLSEENAHSDHSEPELQVSSTLSENHQMAPTIQTLEAHPSEMPNDHTALHEDHPSEIPNEPKALHRFANIK